MDDKRKNDVERVLDQMRPWIKSDGGGVTLLDISNDGVVTVRLEGNCVGCGAQQMTIDEGIKSTMISQLDWVTDVIATEDDTPVDTGPSVRSNLEQAFAPTEALLIELDTALLSMEPSDPLPEVMTTWLRHARTRLMVLMTREEECVFPILRDFLNTAAGPVGLMLREHADLRRLGEELTEAAEAFVPGDEARFRRMRDAGRAVTRQLSSHLIKERGSVFELLDRALPEDLRKELLQDLQRYEAAHNRVGSLTSEGARP